VILKNEFAGLRRKFQHNFDIAVDAKLVVA